jgi:hypothetical protein
MKTKLKKISTSVPPELLKEACRATAHNQTATIIAGLEELIRKKRRSELLSLAGTLAISSNTKINRRRVKL